MTVQFQQTDTTADNGLNVGCSGSVFPVAAFAREATEGGTAGSTEIFPEFDNSATNQVGLTFQTNTGEPNKTTWEAGDYVVRLNITTANSTINWNSVFICERTSSGTYNTVASGSVGTNLGSPGVLSATINRATNYTAAADSTIYIVCTFDNTSQHGGSDNFGFTPNQFIDAPFPATAVEIATAGTLTLTSQNADPIASETIIATKVNLSFTAQNADASTAITAGINTLSVTGLNVNISETITASTGSLSFTPQNVDASTAITASVGSLTLNSQNANLNETTIISGTTALTTLTGQTATAVSDSSTIAGVASLSLTGNDAKINETIVSTTGSLSLTTQNTNLQSYEIATTGSLSLSLFDTNINDIENIVSTFNSLSLNSNQTTVNAIETIDAISNNLVLTANDAKITETIIASIRNLSLTGQVAQSVSGTLAGLGSLNLVGNDAKINETIIAGPGQLTLSALNTTVSNAIIASTASLTLTPISSKINEIIVATKGTLLLSENTVKTNDRINSVTATMSLSSGNVKINQKVNAVKNDLFFTGLNSKASTLIRALSGTLTLTPKEITGGSETIVVLKGALVLTPNPVSDGTELISIQTKHLSLTGKKPTPAQYVRGSSVITLSGAATNISKPFVTPSFKNKLYDFKGVFSNQKDSFNDISILSGKVHIYKFILNPLDESTIILSSESPNYYLEAWISETPGGPEIGRKVFIHRQPKIKIYDKNLFEISHPGFFNSIVGIDKNNSHYLNIENSGGGDYGYSFSMSDKYPIALYIR